MPRLLVNDCTIWLNTLLNENIYGYEQAGSTNIHEVVNSPNSHQVCFHTTSSYRHSEHNSYLGEQTLW